MPPRRRRSRGAPRMHLYHPEMGEKRDFSRLFKASHVWKSKYAIEWPEERDADARAALVAARIRPSSIRLDIAGKDYFPRDNRGNRYTAIITNAALNKLRAFVSYEMLLD